MIDGVQNAMCAGCAGYNYPFLTQKNQNPVKIKSARKDSFYLAHPAQRPSLRTDFTKNFVFYSAHPAQAGLHAGAATGAHGEAALSPAYCPVITTIQSTTPRAAQYRLDSSSFSISARFVRSAALTSSRTAVVPSAWQM